jgi:hypothetical protein
MHGSGIALTDSVSQVCAPSKILMEICQWITCRWGPFRSVVSAIPANSMPLKTNRWISPLCLLIDKQQATLQAVSHREWAKLRFIATCPMLCHLLTDVAATLTTNGVGS